MPGKKRGRHSKLIEYIALRVLNHKEHAERKPRLRSRLAIFLMREREAPSYRLNGSVYGQRIF